MLSLSMSRYLYCIRLFRWTGLILGFLYPTLYSVHIVYIILYSRVLYILNSIRFNFIEIISFYTKTENIRIAIYSNVFLQRDVTAVVKFLYVFTWNSIQLMSVKSFVWLKQWLFLIMLTEWNLKIICQGNNKIKKNNNPIFTES